MNFKLWIESAQWTLYHGSNSPKMEGKLFCNERDSGWFGSGFYLTAYPDYAKRWGQYVYTMNVPAGKYAEIHCKNGYQQIEYLGDAEFANQFAGGNEAWIENELAWSQNFTNTLKKMGNSGVRVHIDNHKDLEVLVFDPSHIQILGQSQ
jgi:hypothetical protein